MKIGDKLWFVQTSYIGEEKGEGKELTITKVGRLYAYSQAEWRLYKIQISNLSVTDERSYHDGQCYLSKDAYVLEKLRQEEWRLLKKLVECQWNAPEGVTLPEIMQIQVLLGMREESLVPRPVRDERAQFFHD